jgi:hypothetical protein
MSSQRNTGFILLHRSIRDHWIYEDANKLKWWLDILMECNHSDQKVSIGFELMECMRGQSLNSILTWSKRWRVDKSTVRRFLKLLEDDAMIVTKNVLKTTHLTVCNYDSYNNKQHPKQLGSNSEATSKQPQSNPNNNDNNDNKVNNDRERERGAFAPHEHEEFKKFHLWLEKNADQVLKMREPFTIKQFFSIKDLAPPETIRDVLKAMHNRADLLKKYRSANLTLRNWLKRETKTNATHQPTTRTTNKNAGAIALLNKAKSDFQIIKGRADNTGS